MNSEIHLIPNHGELDGHSKYTVFRVAVQPAPPGHYRPTICYMLTTHYKNHSIAKNVGENALWKMIIAVGCYDALRTHTRLDERPPPTRPPTGSRARTHAHMLARPHTRTFARMIARIFLACVRDCVTVFACCQFIILISYRIYTHLLPCTQYNITRLQSILFHACSRLPVLAN